jgi:hypothetical protein
LLASSIGFAAAMPSPVAELAAALQLRALISMPLLLLLLLLLISRLVPYTATKSLALGHPVWLVTMPHRSPHRNMLPSSLLLTLLLLLLALRLLALLLLGVLPRCLQPHQSDTQCATSDFNPGPHCCDGAQPPVQYHLQNHFYDQEDPGSASHLMYNYATRMERQ